MKTVFVLLLFALFFLGGNRSQEGTETKASENRRITYRLHLLAQHKHDPASFCQGLVFHQEDKGDSPVFYESCGRYGHSAIRIVDQKTGEVVRSRALEKNFFAEGISLLGDSLYQLTWKEHYCFVYDRKNLQVQKTISYPMEGWGLTNNGQELILSDGSARLYFLDPEDLKVIRTLKVFYRTEKGRHQSLNMLNELEWIEGEIWANVYQTNFIVRIDPNSGEVLQFFNCGSLVPESFRDDSEFVLNGIAYNRSSKRLFLTGKCWPILFELRLETITPEVNKKEAP